MNVILVNFLFILSFAVNVAGASRLICPNQSIKAEEGDDVTLQCHVDPPRDMSADTVDWKRVDLNKVVYSYRHRQHHLDDQMERYRNRTTFDLDGLSRGNLTLRISSAQPDDSGLYRCFVPKLMISCVVNVSVEPRDQKNRTNEGGDATTTRPPVEDAAKTMTYYLTVAIIVGFIIVIVIIGLLVKKKCRREQEAEMAPNNVQMENLMNPEAAEEGEDLDISVENIQQEV